MKSAVVVTGIGWITPLGSSVQGVWDALLAGKSGIAPISSFDADGFPTRIAGEVKNFNPEQWMDHRQARRLDRFSQFALAAAHLAVKDAALDVLRLDPYRIGVLVGSGAGGMATIETGQTQLLNRGPSRVPPLSIPMMMINAGSSIVAQAFGLHGPSFGLVSACSTGAAAIAQAASMILLKQADVMIAGGSEASITPLSLAAFSNCGALSRANDPVQRASRPFDLRRDGFVMSEGAGVLILESGEHARVRSARIYADLAGQGLTSDAHHVTAPDPTAQPAARAITAAIEMAGATPADVDYINAHGTGTPLNDPAEVHAIRLALGPSADRVAVSSSKSMLGHMLGAAGAVEAAITALAVQTGDVPPTINVEEQDPACNIDVVPGTARHLDNMKLALSNSFAFGGHNVCLAFRRI